jgi:hypothetical protein
MTQALYAHMNNKTIKKKNEGEIINFKQTPEDPRYSFILFYRKKKDLIYVQKIY